MILGIDTSSPAGCLAVFEKSSGQGSQWQLLAESSWQRMASHTELATAELQRLMRDVLKAELRSLREISVGVGPGSFTGVRVGINLAKTLAYRLGLSIRPTSSLELLAAPALLDSGPVLAMTNAYRNQVFAAIYSRTSSGQVETLCAPGCFSTAEVEALGFSRLRIVGDTESAFAWTPAFRSRHEWLKLPHPRPSSFVELYALGLDQRPALTWNSLEPLYLRASAAEENLGKKR